MPHEICCVNFKGLIAYLRNHYGAQGVQTAVAGLLDGAYRVDDRRNPDRPLPLDLQHLTNPAVWISNEASLLLFENVARLIPGPEPLRAAGAGAVRESFSRSVLFVARLLGPQRVARRVTQLNTRFNRTKTVELAELAADRAVFALTYRPGFRVTRHVCHWNLGIYGEVARIAGCRGVHGEETACVLDGDPQCRFTITWRPDGPLRRLAAGATRRLSAWLMRDLLEAYEEAAADRDRLIDQLSCSEEKYRTLFQDSMDAMSLTQEGRLVDVNPAWLRLHGYAAKREVAGMEISECIHPEDRPILEARRRSADGRRERVYRLRDLQRDGGAVQVEVYSSPVTYGGRSAILATVRDITALQRAAERQKELEQRLQRAEKMKALATLAGGVAHDLNNILAGIVGYPDLLLSQLPPESPLRKPIALMQQSGAKAVAIVQDLLTLARHETVRHVPLELNRLVREILADPAFGPIGGRYPQVVFHLRCCTEALPVRGSAALLAKALTNLLTNAAEAMPSGGTVTVATFMRRLDSPLNGYTRIEAGRYGVVEITDEGRGISNEDRERVFEPFFTTKKMGQGGSGLGMAVVWGTVKDHHGAIDLQSRLGSGTRIGLYLPLDLEAAADRDRPPDDPQRPRGGGERILVVDDTPEQREVAAEMLRFLGYHPVAVESGEAALTWLAGEACDLVLLDMLMAPGIDGLETFRRIQAGHPGLKVVIASGFSESAQREEAQRLGIDAFLGKPYNLAQLAGALRHALQR
jgi:PAS domain S-box-containing protein